MKNVRKIHIDDSEAKMTMGITLAVHLHVFYPDMIPLFVSYLQNITIPFDLYVSIPETIDTDLCSVESQLNKLRSIQSLVIERVVNRGRDLGPMLCTFGKRLQRYDVFLHLHTKKSPHDSHLNHWTEFILEHLLGNTRITNGILSCMSEDVGIVAPPDFIPDPARKSWHVKENQQLAQQLIDRASITVDLKKEYPFVDFPQGSMFWARTDYLRPLFDLDLQYTDFDDEPLPIDGTIAHALERLFFVWGRDSKPYPSKIYISPSEITFEDNANRLLSYYSTKAERRLQRIRILSYVVVILSVLFTVCITCLLCNK